MWVFSSKVVLRSATLPKALPLNKAGTRGSLSTGSPTPHIAEALAHLLVMATSTLRTAWSRFRGQQAPGTIPNRLDGQDCIKFSSLYSTKFSSTTHWLYIFRHTSPHPKVFSIYSQFLAMKTWIMACNAACTSLAHWNNTFLPCPKTHTSKYTHSHTICLWVNKAPPLGHVLCLYPQGENAASATFCLAIQMQSQDSFWVAASSTLSLLGSYAKKKKFSVPFSPTPAML